MLHKKERLKSRRLSLRLTEEDFTALYEIADKLNCDVSDLVRYAIRKHLVEAKKVFNKHPDVWG